MKFNEVSLQVKIVGALAVMFLVVLTSIVTINYRDQRRNIRAEVYNSVHTLSDAVYNSISYPMSIGDDTMIRQQMAEFKKSMKHAEVFVFGFDKLCTYSSDKEAMGSDLTRQIKSGGLAAELGRLLSDGKASGQGHEEFIAGKHYLTVLRPMPNDTRCHHCHGSTRAVLGGLMVRQNIDRMMASLASLRNKNILIGIGGFSSSWRRLPF